jgi:hypothetical protein
MMLNDIKTKVDFKKLVDSFCTNGTEKIIDKWVEFPAEEKEKFGGNQNES